MCKELFSKQPDVTALKNDIIQMEDATKFMLHQTDKKPEITKCLSAYPHAKQTLLNLNTLMEQNQPPSGIVYRVNSSDYINILKKYDLAKNWSPLDLLYHGAEWTFQLDLVNWDWTNKRTYLAEYGDCDDFGFIFKAHMLELAGITGVMWVIDWSGGHSYNMFFNLVARSSDPLNPDIDIAASKAYVFEPQTDECEEVPELTVQKRWDGETSEQYTVRTVGLPLVNSCWSPDFPKWKALRKARVNSIASDKLTPRDLDPKMYPLKDCILMM